MPIISCTPVDKKIYRVTISLGHCMMENLVITEDGVYEIYYIKDGKYINRTGRILNIVQNTSMPDNSYVLFDWSEDNSNKRERIHFYKIQTIKDITPNDAYKIALEHGFVGSVTDWLESLRGDIGKSAYDIAVECGFEGTEEEWLETIRGERGYSAYEIAKNNGFTGTEEEWLASLKSPGKNAYEVAVDNGFTGSEADWLLSLKGEPGKSAYELAVKYGFEGTEEDWLKSLKGQSAYEAAVARGFEGTEDDWFAQNGDTVAIKKQVEKIIYAMKWVESM